MTCLAMNSYRLIESAWTLAIVAVLVAIMWALTGCTEAQCIRPIVTLERPVLPEVSSAELESISWDAYRRLRERDLLLHQAVEERDIIIREIAEVPE
jgi:hypothetical protein